MKIKKKSEFNISELRIEFGVEGVEPLPSAYSGRLFDPDTVVITYVVSDAVRTVTATVSGFQLKNDGQPGKSPTSTMFYDIKAMPEWLRGPVEDNTPEEWGM